MQGNRNALVVYAKSLIKKALKPLGFRRIYDITFWLTHRCPYNCDYCVIESNSGPLMPKEMVFNAIEAALPKKLGSVQLTGGEPMLHPDFDEICNYIHQKFQHVHIHITGRLLTEKRLEQLKLEDSCWNWWLTLVSKDAETNDRHRAKGALNDCIRAAKLLNEHNQVVRAHIQVVPETLEQLPENIRFAADELGSKYISAEPVCPAGRAVKFADRLLLNDEQLYRYYRMMTDLIPSRAKEGYALTPIRAFQIPSRECDNLREMIGFNLHPNGSVNPCCYLVDKDAALGNINEGLLKVTSPARLKEMRKRFEPTHRNIAERVEKVCIWSCFECLLNFQIHLRGRKELER